MRNLTDDDLPLQRIYRWERERANQTFLTQPYDGGKLRVWTWAQAVSEARSMAAWLKAQDWEPGSRVAILSRNCAWWILADMSIWMAGHVSVPVYPSLKEQSIRQILEHCEAKACFLGPTDDPAASLSAIPPDVLRVGFPTAPDGDYVEWRDLIATHSPIAGFPVRSADDLSTIIYTSGTTGAPKGVMHSFAAFSFDTKTIVEMLGMDSNQRILSYLPLAHIVERIGAEQLAIFLGSQVFFTEGIDSFLTDLQRARPTIFLSVPRLLLKFQQGVYARIPKEKLERLLAIPVVNGIVRRRVLRALGLSTVRYAASGAAPLPTEILIWYRKLGLPLIEGYGMTETAITHLPVLHGVRPGFVGRAIPGVDTQLGENDELLIRSPMNLLGYFKDPEGTRTCMTEDGYFRTGDEAYIAPDGQLKIVGRLKDQFKTSKGKYVAPGPIEGLLTTHPAIEAGCLMGAGLSSPFAVILLSEDARQRCTDAHARGALEASLRAHMDGINEELNPHERVRFLAIADGPWTVGNGVMTPTLKIKRAVLEQRYRRMVDTWSGQNLPIVWESTAESRVQAYVAMPGSPVRHNDCPPSQT